MPYGARTRCFARLVLPLDLLKPFDSEVTPLVIYLLVMPAAQDYEVS